MVFQHAKKREDDIADSGDRLDGKRGDAASSSNAAAVRKRPINGMPRTNPTGRVPTRGGGRVVLNSTMAIAAFIVLVQWFDPTANESAKSLSTENNLNVVSKATSSSTPMGRERILGLLEEAGIAKDLTEQQIMSLPTWKQIVELYGNEVIIVGKEDCARYRQRVPKSDRRVAVAGMFNTGTNLLDTQMQRNINVSPLKKLWQVPWGKHRMASTKYNHTAPDFDGIDKDTILPVVIIRDPFSWLQSMCAHPYAASWRHSKRHCPNLVPNEADRQGDDPPSDFSLTVNFDKNSKYDFDSLVHLWSEYYAEYLHVDYPILMVRYEDLVFQPVAVLVEIAHCVEGTLKTPIHYQVATSKSHGSGTDYVKALTKTADAVGRSRNMTMDDLLYARQHLDPRLMSTFHYQVPSQTI